MLHDQVLLPGMAFLRKFRLTENLDEKYTYYEIRESFNPDEIRYFDRKQKYEEKQI